jgi:hypothetical protein
MVNLLYIYIYKKAGVIGGTEGGGFAIWHAQIWALGVWLGWFMCGCMDRNAATHVGTPCPLMGMQVPVLRNIDHSYMGTTCPFMGTHNPYWGTLNVSHGNLMCLHGNVHSKLNIPTSEPHLP